MSATRRVPQVYTDTTVALEPGGPLGRDQLVVRKRGVEVITLEAAATNPSRPDKHTGHRLALPHEGVDLGDVVTGVHVSAGRLHLGLTREAAQQVGLPSGDRRLVCHVASMSDTPEAIRNATGLILGEGSSPRRLLTTIDSGFGAGPDTDFGVYVDAYAPVAGNLEAWRGY